MDWLAVSALYRLPLASVRLRLVFETISGRQAAMAAGDSGSTRMLGGSVSGS